MRTATALQAEMRLSAFSPLGDHRWDEFARNHPLSSVFHTRAWLKALQRTYGYEPVLVANADSDGALQSGIVFASVKSWLTGRRLVSLPFADHCAPLVSDSSQLCGILAGLKEAVAEPGLRYVEVRPTVAWPAIPHGCVPAQSYCHQELDLSPAVETLFANFHKNSTQRKIRRAEKEGLAYAEGRTADFVDEFYKLLIVTRQRHGLPPQPIEWFRNLAEEFGDALKIRVASAAGTSVAAILTLEHKDTLTYKYGASDARFNALGGTHLLFWESIKEAKRRGLRRFDLGRSDWGNTGLITFKQRWGAKAAPLKYFRLPISSAATGRESFPGEGAWHQEYLKAVVQRLPRPTLRWLGELLYRHIG